MLCDPAFDGGAGQIGNASTSARGDLQRECRTGARRRRRTGRKWSIVGHVWGWSKGWRGEVNVGGEEAEAAAWPLRASTTSNPGGANCSSPVLTCSHMSLSQDSLALLAHSRRKRATISHPPARACEGRNSKPKSDTYNMTCMWWRMAEKRRIAKRRVRAAAAEERGSR